MPQSLDQWEPETTEFLQKYLMDTKYFRIIAFNNSENTYGVAMFTLHNKINVANLLIKNSLAIHINSR